MLQKGHRFRWPFCCQVPFTPNIIGLLFSENREPGLGRKKFQGLGPGIRVPG